jgi:hydrogenase-4 component B
VLDAAFFFSASISFYLLGAAAAGLWCLRPRRSYYAAYLLAACGGVCGLISSLWVLLGPLTHNEVSSLIDPAFRLQLPWLGALTNISSLVKLFNGFSLQMDILNAFFVLIISLVAIPVSIYAIGYTRDYEGKRSVALLGVLYNLFILSMLLVVTANNAMLFLIVWEIMSIVSYFLVVFEHEKSEHRHAGFVYLAMMHIGTAFLFLLFLLFYQYVGSFDFSTFRDAVGRFPEAIKNLAFVFALIGFGTKAGLVPVHIWLPYAHLAAPSPVSALMSGVMVKTAVYGLLRIFFDFMRPELVWWWGAILLVIASLSAILGILYATTEKDLKKLLAYSSIENMGIILVGVSLAMIFVAYPNQEGFVLLAAVALVAGLYHMLNHALFKSLLFLGAGAVYSQTRTRNLEALGGLIKKMPWTAVCFLIGALSIASLPPLNGFISEWLTFQALLRGLDVPELAVKILVPLSAALLALGAALAAACFVKAFGIAFLALPRSAQTEHAREVSGSMKWSMGALASLCLALGLLPVFVLKLFDNLIAKLFEGALASNLVFSQQLEINWFILTAPVSSSFKNSVLVSPLGLGLILILVIFVALAIAYFSSNLRTRVAPTWAGGLPRLTARTEYTATGFSKPIRLIFQSIYQPRKEIEIETDLSTYVPKRIRYELQSTSPFETYLYQPISELILKISNIARRIQTGSVNTYLAYIFVVLIILLLWVR